MAGLADCLGRLDVGRVYGRYLINSRRKYNWATLYDAFDIDTGKGRKMKGPHSNAWKRSDGLYQKHTQEVRFAERLEHPHIVKVFPTFYHEDIPYLVMEDLPLTLDAYFRKPMKENEFQKNVLRLFEEIGQSLSYIHDLGSTHRDVNERNILLDSEGRFKLIDFNFVKRVSEDCTPNADFHDLCFLGLQLFNEAYPSGYPESLDERFISLLESPWNLHHCANQFHAQQFLDNVGDIKRGLGYD